MSKPGGKKNSRGMWMAIAFCLGLSVVAVEVWLVFRNQWDLFEAVMAENPTFLFGLLLPQLSIPVALALLAGAASGRRIGEEAETIARGLKP